MTFLTGWFISTFHKTETCLVSGLVKSYKDGMPTRSSEIKFSYKTGVHVYEKLQFGSKTAYFFKRKLFMNHTVLMILQHPKMTTKKKEKHPKLA